MERASAMATLKGTLRDNPTIKAQGEDNFNEAWAELLRGLNGESIHTMDAEGVAEIKKRVTATQAKMITAIEKANGAGAGSSSSSSSSSSSIGRLAMWATWLQGLAGCLQEGMHVSLLILMSYVCVSRDASVVSTATELAATLDAVSVAATAMNDKTAHANTGAWREVAAAMVRLMVAVGGV